MRRLLALALLLCLCFAPGAQQQEGERYHLISSKELSNIELLQATYEQEKQYLQLQVKELREKVSRLIDYSQELNLQLQEQNGRNRELERLFGQLETGGYQTMSSVVLENNTLKFSTEKLKSKTRVLALCLAFENVLIAIYFFLKIKKILPF